MSLPERTQSPDVRAFSLHKQFLAMAAIVLALGMGGIGIWVTSEIEAGVTDNAAAITALYVDGIVAPLTRSLEDGRIDQAASDALDRILRQGALSREIEAFKLWDKTGTILYSDNHALVGQRFELTAGLKAALDGQLHAEFDALYGPENVSESAHSAPLLEIYSPIRSSISGDVIGVAEFYAEAATLQSHLFETRLQTWGVVGGVTMLMLSVFYVLIIRADRTIVAQRAALDDRLTELSDLLHQNRQLTRRVERARQSIGNMNERTLRRISSELHDGPTQQLAFAALRLDSAKVSGDQAVLQPIRQAVDEAIQEIRQICRGLSLPELADWPLPVIARHLAEVHETRTGRPVHVEAGEGLPDLPLGSRVDIYRFMQEALNNVAKHAGEVSPRLTIRAERDGVAITIADEGKGFDMRQPTRGLGLVGLKDRVAGLKGRLELSSETGAGTRISMWVPNEQGDDEF